ncbi:MAG: hypothetical protein ORO03_11690, partial [Alphaproteobacteria bacterium]|nr:hypothetical protein [Alphaproteobacteria bacterium]
LPPRSLNTLAWIGGAADNLPTDYSWVAASGVFIPGTVRRWLGQFDGEQSGIHILQAFRLQGEPSALIWVDRGFIANSPSGEIAAVPVLSAGISEAVTGWFLPKPKRGRFTPANQPENNLWFSPDFAGFCQSLVPASSCESEHYLLAMAEVSPDTGLPTKIQNRLPELVNNHLHYAITWFSLALILAVVFGLMVWREVKRSFGSSLNPRIE